MVRFGEPLLTGVTLASAQNAITAALGSSTSVSAAAQTTAATTLAAYMNRTCCGNTVIPGVVTVSGPYGAITGGVTASSDSLSITFAPSVPLTSNTTYTVKVNGVRDSAGNLMTQPFTSTFTTGASVDTSIPTVKLVDPENNSTGVPTNAHYTVQFSKAMDPASLTQTTFTVYDQTASANIAGTVQVDATGMTASFVPSAPLPVSRSFTVTLTTSIKDTVGNYLASAGTYYFTTGYTPESGAPHFTTSSPLSGATGIPVNAIIDLKFSQPLNITTVVPNLTIATNGQPIAVQTALSSGDQRVTVTPVAGLQANATYTVTLGPGITNIAGTAIDNPGTFSFQTAALVDKSSFTVVSYTPTSNATSVPLNAQISVGFSKPADVVTLSNVVLYPYSLGTGYPVAGTLTPSATASSFTFTPASTLLSNTQYCIYFYGVTDLEGDQLSGSSQNCFTTGAATQAGGPTVISISPQNGATGAPVNAVVEVGLSEAVSAVSVGSNAITVTAAGQPVAGTVTVPNATTILFSPANTLATGTVYSVAVGGFTDLAGNPATAFTSTFTTSGSSAPVTSGPSVLNISPANGTTNVAVTTTVVITFSAAVNPATVNSSSIAVETPNGYTVAGSYAVSGAVVTFTPLTPLPGSTSIHVYVGYNASVQDAVGNNTQSTAISFTTAATLDTTPPTILSVTPASGQTAVGLNGQIVVVFSKSMNPSTLNTSDIALLAGDVKQSFSISTSADNRTLTLYNLDLPASTVVTLAISSGAADLSGNALANFTSQFTTGAAYNTTHASVTSQRPASGATGVSTGASPVVLFVNKPLNASTITASTVQVTQNGQIVAGTINVAGNGQTIEFTPSAPWTYGALVQIFLDPAALETGGNTVNSYSGSFTVTGDPTLTAPTILNYSPINGSSNVPLNAHMDVQFSGALSASTVNTTNVYLNGPSGAVTGTVKLDATGTVVTFSPAVALKASSEYCFYIYNVQGISNKAAQNLGFCFNTGTAAQTAAPSVVSVSPGNKLANVPVNANVSAIFSGTIDPLTVNGSTIFVSGGGFTSMPASISFSNNNSRVEVTPEAPLPASTQLTLTISGVTDVAGNPVTPQTTTFTTSASAATATPGILVENPVNGATGVAVNAAISLQANAPVDPTSVNTSTFQVYDDTLDQTVAGSYTFSTDGATVYFVPAAQLATGRQYSVYFSGYGMTDLAGNLVTNSCTGCLYNFSFTTGFATSTTPPQVTGVSPANGLQQVPLNAQIVLSFSEPVNAETLAGVTLSANGNAVALSNRLGSGNQLLTITPVAGLLPNTTYTLAVNGVADLSGNVMTTGSTSTFSTGGTVDLTELTIVSVAPSNGTASVPLNAQVQVAFSKGVDVVSLAGGNLIVYPYSVGSSYPVAGTLSVSANGKIATFTPTGNLLAETQYGIYVSGVVDLEGNSLSGSSTSSFTTGAATQASGPAVSGISPPNASPNVPVNATIEVGLNEAVSAVSVGSSSIVVTAAGKAVSGTVTQPTSTILLFTPASALTAGTVYSVAVGGFTDLTGNAASAFTSGFTTSSSSSPVTSGPSVLNVSPFNGATGIAVTTPIVVTFSAPINPLSINSNSFLVTANGTEVAGTSTVSGAVLTFAPLTALPGGAAVHVYVAYNSYPQDLAGNNTGSSSTSFTTAATADITAPTILSVAPANGQTGVGLNGQIVVVFSKSMNPATLTASTIALLAGDVKQSFGISISPDNRTLTLTSLNLPGSTVLTLAISSGAADLSGNAPAVDTPHASVVSQRPANGATGVLTTASPVTLFVNKTLNASTVNGNTFQVTQNGQLAAGTIAVVGDGQSIQFTPSAAWPNGALVQVFLDAAALDTNGNTVNAYKGSFTVIGAPAATAPALLNYSPAGNAVPLNAIVDAQFSEPLNPATVIAANAYLNGPTGTVANTLTLDSTGTIIRLIPKSALTASSEYCFYFYNLQGTSGLALPGYGNCFNTSTAAQTTAPTVLTVSPADKLTNVPLNADISALFSGPIDPLSISGSSIVVSGGGSTAVPSTISFSNGNTRVVITPQAPLPASTLMLLTITGVKDPAGNTVATQTTHFTTTTAAATSTAGILLTNPTNGAVSVPVNVAISLQANAPIDLTTVNTSTFQVYDNTLNQTVPGSYSLSADGMTVFFAPSAQFATGRQYSVYYVNYGMTDLAGNSITGCSGCAGNFSFTTGFTTAASAPQVTGVSPSSGSQQVPINAQIVVSFNEPVSLESLSGVTLSVNGSPVGLSNSLSSGNQLLTITPVAGLLPNTAYSLSIAGVTDVAGDAMPAPVTSTFTTSGTADLTALTIVSFDPASGATGVPTNARMRVGFSKGVDSVSLAGGNFIVYPYNIGTGYPIAGALSVSTDGKTATFTPTSSLLAETHYCIYVSGVVDLEGDNLTGSSNPCFTTGSGAQTSGPAVTAISPPNLATGVPVNATIEVGLSEPVSQVSVGSSALTVSAGGQTIAGTLTIPNTSTLLFTPAAPLAASTTYTVAVGGFTDLAGNAATSFNSSFTSSSSSTAVRTGPTVLNVTPFSGSTGVAVNTAVVITFSAAVNPLTINASSIGVTANGTQIAGTYAVSGATVTFTPLNPLPGSATIRVYVAYNAYPQDFAGNNSSSSNTSFTTAATADTTAPTVVSVAPANGQTGVGINGQIVVTFSKSMNPSTLNSSSIAVLAQDVKQSFGTSISADNTTLTLSSLNLPASTVITLSISGATDISGNALANYTSQFTTGPAFDTTHASVVTERPASGATGVSTAASPIVLFLNKPLNASTINSNSLQVTQNGQLVTGTIAVVGNGQTIEFTPASPFAYSALIQVFLDANAVDTIGNAVNAYKGSFTIAGTPASTAPAIVNYSPVSGSTAVPLNPVLDTSFNEPIATATVTSANVYLQGSSGTVASTLSLDATGTILRLIPKAPLAANSQYCFYNYNLLGTNGLNAANHGSCFTTGTASQTTAPSVQTVAPQNGLGNVPLNANLSVIFSGPIDPISVTGSTVFVSGGGANSMPASISFSNNNTKVEITPEAPLPASTQLSFTISGVTDLAGNTVTAQTTHFTTGTAAAITSSGIIAENPVNGQTSVPSNAAISLQANAAIDGTTVNTSTFQIYDTTLGTTLAGRYTLSADATTVYFLPATPLAAGREYSVYFQNYGMTDLAGNAINGCSGCLGNFSFTVGFALSNTAPQVIAVSPAASATQVPINSQIVVSFNEPVNAESLAGVTLSAGGSTVGLSTSLSSGNQFLTITPVAGLLPATAYTLRIAGVADMSGNVMASPVTSAFTTGTAPDLTSLSALAIDPANNTTGVPLNALIHVQFNKPVDAATLSTAQIQLYPYVTSAISLPGAISLSGDARTVTFTPSVPLLAETHYCIYGSGIQDLEGNTYSNYSCFTTGAAAQTTGPAVLAVTPPNAATNVPVNTLIAVSLNDAVAITSVGNSAVTVTAGGQAVAGSISIANTTVQFVPTSALAPGTTYTIAVGGFNDLAGNIATSFTSTFTTSSSSTPVKTGPTVSSVTPSNGAGSISVTTPIVVSFSAAVDPLTISTGSVFVTANGNGVAGSYAVSGSVVTFTPSTPLPGGATIHIYVGYNAYVQDFAGNNSGSSSTSFTTAGTADTTIPTVLSVTPANNQLNVGQTGQISVMFSKSMNPATLSTSTISLLAGSVRQSYSLAVSADNRTITLSGLNLPGASVITLAISNAVTDLSGNALASFTSQFATAANFDTTHASVVSQRPAAGVTGVGLAASPVVLFLNKPLNASTINSNSLEVTENGQVVSGSIAVIGDGQTIAFTPSSAWTYGAFVQVFLTSSALDTDGNTVDAYKGSFNVAGNPATTAPSLANYSPISSATAIPLNVIPDAIYTEPLNPSSVIAANVYLYSYGTSSVVPSTLTLDSTGTIIHLTPNAPLAVGTQYQFALYNLVGANGLSVSGQAHNFTTGGVTQTAGPHVSTLSPGNNLANVPVNANISVIFSAPIDPLSVSGTTIALSGGGNSYLPGTINFSQNNQKVTITPEAPLPASTVMTLAISGVRDVAGNAVTAQTTQFTTGTAAATSTPGILVENPAASATGVPTNAALSLQANAPLDLTTVNTGTYQVYDTTLSQTVAGSYTLSADGMTVFFVPPTQLATGRTYDVNFNGYGMTDLAGNSISSNCTSCLNNFVFTTGYSTSTTPPQVAAVSPVAGQQQVPINAQVVVSFSEPVNGESLAGITLSTGGNSVPLTYSLSSGNQLLTLTPNADLLAGATYTLAVNAVSDLSGNVLATPFTSTFVTSGGADLATPVVSAITPSNAATAVLTTAPIQVSFDKLIDQISVSGQTVKITTNGSTFVTATYSFNPAGNVLTITPAAALSPSTTYTLQLTTGILDLEGNALTAFQSTFTTGAH